DESIFIASLSTRRQLPGQHYALFQGAEDIIVLALVGIQLYEGILYLFYARNQFRFLSFRVRYSPLVFKIRRFLVCCVIFFFVDIALACKETLCAGQSVCIEMIGNVLLQKRIEYF